METPSNQAVWVPIQHEQDCELLETVVGEKLQLASCSASSKCKAFQKLKRELRSPCVDGQPLSILVYLVHLPTKALRGTCETRVGTICLRPRPTSEFQDTVGFLCLRNKSPAAQKGFIKFCKPNRPGAFYLCCWLLQCRTRYV